ncbi:MAG TPA: hypothetical protein VF119_02575 [Candidatus Limnocylindrales bacterium]
MTEPHEETDAAPTSSEPVPETGAPVPPTSGATPDEAPTGEPAATLAEPTPEPTPEPTAAPVTGWVAPEGAGSGGGRRRGCLIAVIVLGAFLVLGYIGLVFLGNQVRTVLAGTIQFGTGGTGCSVTGTATTFPASASIRSVAFLKEDVAAGTTLTTIVTFPDGTSDTGDQTLDTTAGCVTQAIESGLPAGHYGLEYRVGTETVAKGAFDITP